MADVKELLKEVVSRFKKASATDNEATERMLRIQKRAKEISKELKAEKE